MFALGKKHRKNGARGKVVVSDKKFKEREERGKERGRERKDQRESEWVLTCSGTE